MQNVPSDLMSLHFQPAQGVSTRIIAGREGAVLFHADTRSEQWLNSTGLLVWEELSAGSSVAAIARRLENEYEGVRHADALRDVNALIQVMAEKGFVTQSSKEIERGEIGCVMDKPVFPNMQEGPKTIDISVTGKCNLSCKYCFYADSMAGRSDLSLEEWLTFFAELGRLSVRSVCLSGGEPFTRSDFFDLVDGLIENNMRFSVLTNGSLVTPAIIKEFEKGKRRIRLDSIQVSIDGSCPEVHDMSRGKGAFDKAVRGLRRLKEAGLPVTSRVTLNRHNVDDLDNIAKLLLDDIGLSSIGTNDAVPIGSGCNNQNEITLLPGQQVQAMFALERLEKKYNGRITAAAGPLANLRLYRDMERGRETGEKPKKWQMGYLSACGCVYDKLAVHHDGVIIPCNMLPQLHLGQINKDEISKIWQGHEILSTMKERRAVPMSQVIECKECEWHPYCNGGCPSVAYDLYQDLKRANPHGCYKRFLNVNGNILRQAQRAAS